MNEVYEKALNHFGYEAQLNKAIEELAECIVELSKCHYQLVTTGKFNLTDLCSEIADVEIMIEQIKMMSVEHDEIVCNVGDFVDLARTYKLKRLDERLCNDV